MNEGNLYNIEDEISHKGNPSIVGISQLQMEIRKKIIEQLRRQKITNVEKIIKKTFGKTLDKS
jgi:hypothetical protein